MRSLRFESIADRVRTAPTARGSDTETRIVFHNIGGNLLQSRSERMINLCYLPLTHRSLLT